jgi:hypothetical protein
MKTFDLREQRRTNMPLSKWTPTTDLMMLRRMGKLGEELGELQAVAARCIIQGIDEVDPSSGRVNRQRLQDELSDVMAQCEVTISALGLDTSYIAQKTSLKKEHMAEWEAMFAEPPPDKPWRPVRGCLVRYDDGVTALALLGEPHAGGWHGEQCMGGHRFFTNVYEPSAQDRETWARCAVRYRGKTQAQADFEAYR